MNLKNYEAEIDEFYNKYNNKEMFFSDFSDYHKEQGEVKKDINLKEKRN